MNEDDIFTFLILAAIVFLVILVIIWMSHKLSMCTELGFSVIKCLK